MTSSASSQTLNTRLPTLAPKLAATPRIWARRPGVGDGISTFREWAFTKSGESTHAWIIPPTSPTPIRDQREEEWVDRPQKIWQSRDKFKADLWLSTAGQWGSLGSGSAVVGPEKKRTGVPPPPNTVNHDKGEERGSRAWETK